MKYYLSTTADIETSDNADWTGELINTDRSARLAAANGLGLEIAEYCISDSLDTYFDKTDEEVRAKLALAGDCILHGPYNELYPCAIDPLALNVAKVRHHSAYKLAMRYKAPKIVFHTGFAPAIYFESWYLDRSIIYWKEFLKKHPGDIILCVENVMEQDPELMYRLADGVADDRFRLTLDVGHAFRSSDIPVTDWLERMAPYLSHFHIHNNEGTYDTHNALGDGCIPMEDFLRRANELCPDATFTVESIALEESVDWLRDKNFIK